MDKQKIFNKVAKHLLTQNAKSQQSRKGPFADSAMCLYRNGTRACAIGCLIPDELYHKQFENNSIYAILTQPEYISGDGGPLPFKSTACKKAKAFRKLLEFRNIGRNMKFLQTLQKVHDDTEVVAWPVHLEEVAIMYHLKIPKFLADRAAKVDTTWTTAQRNTDN